MTRNPLARRLAAVEQKRDARRLMHTYRLADGTTARLSSLDVLAATMDGMRLRGQQPTEPPAVVRTLAQVDPDDDPSMWGSLARALAAEWCAAYDEGRPVALDEDDLDDDQAAEGPLDPEGAPRG